MTELTPLERAIVQFIQSYWKDEGVPPTLHQVAFRFGLENESVARRHISFLQEKGYLAGDQKEDYGVRVWTPWTGLKSCLDIPLLGTISCGIAEETTEEIRGYVPVSLEKLGIAPSKYLFAVEAKGDSMIGRQIAEGDYVILDKNRIPKSGDIVAALIDNESTLKTFIRDNDEIYLRPENPKYKNIYPAEDATIQGVMVLLIRKPN